MATEQDSAPPSAGESLASAPAGAVFLSYASEDAAAAERIATALRSASIEVWFDKTELRGGDAWDRQIRKQIHDCALFIPIVSAHSQARLEGYFRREWKLAADRTHDMAEEKAFLVPVVIDDTSERYASVPEKFREMQWTHLSAGDTSAAFIERVTALLSSDHVQAPQQPRPAAVAAYTSPLDLQQSARNGGSFRRYGLPSVVVAVLLAAGALVIERFWLSKHAAASTQAAVSTSPSETTTHGAIPEKSIAVLPFVDMSENHDQEYFAEGVAEELLDLLAKIPGLRVIGRTSSFQFKGKAVDLRTIGSMLGAAYALEGSVRRSVNRIRVTAQLISTRDGTNRWSDTFEAPTQDSFKLQDAIATGLARALEVAVSSGPASDPVRENAEAYDLYMKGRQSLDQSSEQGLLKAAGLFKQVLSMVPNSALAMTQLAITYDWFGNEGWGGIPAVQAFDTSEKYAQQAIRLQPSLAFAHAVLADIHAERDWDWDRAQHEIDLALQSGGENESPVLTAATRVVSARGDWQSAEAYGRRALALDPLDPLAHETLGLFVYMRSNREAEAEPLLRRALEIRPDYGFGRYELAICLLMLGRFDDALAEAQSAGADNGQYEAMAAVLYAMKRTAEADASLAKAIKTDGSGWPSSIARLYGIRKDADKALSWLEKAYQLHDQDLYLIKGDPQLQSLVGDPRYKAFLRKMNLPE
jgi:TolB-like protein/Tfp pilus assembly protein PilF